jgi:probable rRNA maturation factor
MTHSSPITISISYGIARQGLPLKSQIIRWLAVLLKNHAQPIELSIRYVDEAEGKTLNHQYRKKKYATNVLSFSAQDDGPLKSFFLGDIVLCVPVILREAQAQKKKPLHHFAHMLIHATLHLLGHDHQTQEQAQIMEALEIAALQKLRIANPYI